MTSILTDIILIYFLFVNIYRQHKKNTQTPEQTLANYVNNWPDPGIAAKTLSTSITRATTVPPWQSFQGYYISEFKKS